MNTENTNVREGAIFVERIPQRRKKCHVNSIFGKSQEKLPIITIFLQEASLQRYKEMSYIIGGAQCFHPFLLLYDRIRECVRNDHIGKIPQDVLNSYNDSGVQTKINLYISKTDLQYFKEYEKKYGTSHIKIIELYLIRRSYDDAYKILKKQNKKKVVNFKKDRKCKDIQIYLKVDRRAYKYFVKKAKNPILTKYVIEDYLVECYLDEHVFLIDGKKIFYPMKFIKSPDYLSRGIRIKIYEHALKYFDLCASQLNIKRDDFMRAYLEACAKYRADTHGRTRNGFIGIDFEESYQKELYLAK